MKAWHKLVLTLLLLVSSHPAWAKAELVQIVALDWNESLKTLKFLGLGSGTAINKNHILTNKHVVVTEDKTADLILLCPAQEHTSYEVECTVPAGVSTVHETADVALIRPLDQRIFFPHVKTTLLTKRINDEIRIFGFPAPDERFLNLGSKATWQAFADWQKKPTKPLNLKGDKITVTRGKVLARYMTLPSKTLYTLTNAKVNFGNSGGAAFDKNGAYIGIPSLKNEAGQSYILEYPQIDEWIKANLSKTPRFSYEARQFFNRINKTFISENQRRTRQNQASQTGSQLQALRRRLGKNRTTYHQRLNRPKSQNNKPQSSGKRYPSYYYQTQFNR